MKKAVIIMPYFGRIPVYFNPYLKSLEGQPFDVLWISDLKVSQHPGNFKIVEMSFEECKKLISDKLQTKVVVNGAYRLCDFRPMYGKIFEDYITEYDYWGWGDCDLVYGRKFALFLNELMSTCAYDAISLHKDYMSGPTSFYRNSERLRAMYLETNNWREVCAYEGCTILNYDECGGLYHRELSTGAMTLEDCSRKRDSFPAALWRSKDLNIYKGENICETSLFGTLDVVRMTDGILTYNNEEIGVFHYILSKAYPCFRFPRIGYDKICDYEIASCGFFFTRTQRRLRKVLSVWRKTIGTIESVKRNGLIGSIKKFLIKR